MENKQMSLIESEPARRKYRVKFPERILYYVMFLFLIAWVIFRRLGRRIKSDLLATK
jgi:hypothetical protein